jgi:hypothetical protein
MKVDYNDVKVVTIASQDTEDNAFDITGYKITIVIPESDAAAELAAYDQASATSPSEADSRIIARLVLDALKKIVEG